MSSRDPCFEQPRDGFPTPCDQGDERQGGSFTLTWYFRALASLVVAPGLFFRGLGEGQGSRRPVGFLLVSALVHAIAGSHFETGPPWVGFVLKLANALGMTVFSALIAFTIARMTSLRSVRYSTIFSMFAYASGVTLLVSWVPMLVWVTEPWKWFLIAIGLVHGAGLRWPRALWVVVATIGMVILFFWSLGEFIAWFKGETSG